VVLLAMIAAAGVAAVAADPDSGRGGAGEPIMLPEPAALPTRLSSEGFSGDAYIAEVVDSTFFVGPAEFFALDLPTKLPGAHAVHLSGTVTANGGKRDIVVRLFRGADYDPWLKKRGGAKAAPFYSSAKSRVINLDHELPPGEPVVLLLDNGYSIRTPKRVHCQLQIQYRRAGSAAVPAAGAGRPGVGSPQGAAGDDVVPTPRSNEEEEIPPPPPPPPDTTSN
jgi:hypothetical protein